MHGTVPSSKLIVGPRCVIFSIEQTNDDNHRLHKMKFVANIYHFYK